MNAVARAVVPETPKTALNPLLLISTAELFLNVYMKCNDTCIRGI